jgi:hypothetical protein
LGKTKITMRSLVGILATAVVILSVALFYEMRRRHETQRVLDSLLSEKPKEIIRAAQSRAGEDQTSALAALSQENRELRARIERTGSHISDVTGSKIAALKDVLSRLPDQAIPELRLASDGDWVSAVDGPLESLDDYRVALSKLRGAAEKRFALKAQPALSAYLTKNGGKFPTDLSDLKPLLDEHVDEAMLRRYKIVPASEVKNVKVGGEWAITQKSLVDSKNDSRSVIGPQGYGAFGGR